MSAYEDGDNGAMTRMAQNLSHEREPDPPCPRTLALYKPNTVFPTVFHAWQKRGDGSRVCELCGELRPPLTNPKK